MCLVTIQALQYSKISDKYYTTQGVASFVSKRWGSHVSDRHITENSSFIQNMLPGDVVLADRGFNVADCLGAVHATLHIPAYTKGKDQLIVGTLPIFISMWRE